MKWYGAVLASFLVLSFVTAAEPKAEKVKQPGASYDSPQAVFEAQLAADKKEDFKAAVACFTPEAQKDMAASLAAGALHQRKAAQADPKLKEQFKLILAALDNHRLTDDVTKNVPLDTKPEERAKTVAAVAPLIKDPAALAADLQEAYSKTEPFNQQPKDSREPKLSNVQINGDKATGTVSFTVNGVEVKQTAQFAKEGGAWKLAPERQSSDAPAEQIKGK